MPPIAEAPEAPEIQPAADEKPGAAARTLWGGASQAAPGGTGRAAKKGRASMPSWDEIVFGARTDDDLA